MVAMAFMSLSLRGAYSDVQWGGRRILLKDWQRLVWVSQVERVCGGLHKVRDLFLGRLALS